MAPAMAPTTTSGRTTLRQGPRQTRRAREALGPPQPRGLDQGVREAGVLGQERAVEVGAEGVAADSALAAVLTVIPEAADHPPQRLPALVPVGPATAVLAP